MNRTLLREVGVLSLKQNGYSAKLMQAARLTGEYAHGLPPGKPIMAIPIHSLPGAPNEWVKDSGSYVVEVDAEHGLWFDWTDNDRYNTAIVPTVKGMNPITGLKTENVGMHQYRKECPVHNVAFAHNNFCEECGYNWPAQNYISHPNILWQDGFRQSDGSVRQFFFTEEDKRDIASAIIGKKNTVPAFGFAFYRCKNDRHPKQKYQSFGTSIFTPGYVGGDPIKGEELLDMPGDDIFDYHSSDNTGGMEKTGWSSSSSSSLSSESSNTVSHKNSGQNLLRKRSLRKKSFSFGKDNPKFDEKKSQERFNKDVSVGAGAKICQNLEIDQTPLEEWGEKPEAIITLYFVFSEQLEQIIEKGGIKKLESKSEGYLENVPVG